MVPLSGVFNDLSADFPELRKARHAHREYIACLIVALLVPAILLGLFVLLN